MTSRNNDNNLLYCRDRARKVIRDYSLSTLPISVEDISIKDGLVIKYLEDESNSFSGILHRELKAIGVNASHPKVRQRFSIAHELGHYFLNHPQEAETLSMEDSHDEWRQYEREANEFAGELLVPKDMLKRELDSLKRIPTDQKVDLLANTFDVSRDVLVIQLTKHGLLMRI